MKIGICIPHLGSIKTKTVISIIRMLREIKHDYQFITQEGSVLHLNRERLVKEALKQDCTHILFVDSDMIFPGDALQKLIDRDKDIIGTIYHARTIPLQKTYDIKDGNGGIINEEVGELLKVAAAPTGFLLIKAEVFNKLEHPWFFWEVDEEGNTTCGEDNWFCRKARQAGYEIFIDPTIEIKHIGEFLF